MDANNIGNLLSFKFLAREPVHAITSKPAGWHLVLTLPTEKEGKAFGSFKYADKVYRHFDEVLQVLSYIYDDREERTFHRAFKNIIKYFETKARSILLLPAGVILEMLSTALLEFSRVLRDPSLNGISRDELFIEFNRRVAIDESEFYIDALMQARASDALAVSRKSAGGFKSVNPQQRVSFDSKVSSVSSGRTPVVQSNAQRCFAHLSHELNVYSEPCRNKPCRFSHEKLPVPLPVALKLDLINRCSGIKHLDHKKRLTDAINSLPSV